MPTLCQLTRADVISPGSGHKSPTLFKMPEMSGRLVVLTGAGKSDNVRLAFMSGGISITPHIVELSRASEADIAGAGALIVMFAHLDAATCEDIAWLLRRYPSMQAVAASCTLPSFAAPQLLCIFQYFIVTSSADHSAAMNVCGPARTVTMRSMPTQSIALQSAIGLSHTPSLLVPSLVLDPRATLELDGLHRSGWQFALSGLRRLFLNSAATTPLILDTYLDRTFASCTASPYTTRWAGFLHHPYDCSYICPLDSVYHTLDATGFRQSLDQCVALFTLSEDLAKKVRDHLRHAIGPAAPPVVAVRHPTQLRGVLRFDMNAFRVNALTRQSRVLQIGSWLRVSGAIAALPTQRHRRTVLQAPGTAAATGSQMSGTMCTHGEFSTATACGNPLCCPSEQTCPFVRMCRPTFPTTNYDVGQVDVLETVSNQEYDRLLSCNIVFLRLCDASAVNTIIECIARGTPVIVNRLPAIVEYLGSTYPGFYDDSVEGWLERAAELADSDTAVSAMSSYLMQMDKSPLSLESFTKAVHSSLTSALIR